MKLLYVHDAPVPSPAANGVQVAKMCQAFQAAGAETTLVVPRQGKKCDHYQEIAENYGLMPRLRFAVTTAPLVKMLGSKLLYGAVAIMKLPLRWPDVVITRSISIALVAVRYGLPTVFELHNPVDDLRPRMLCRLRRIVHARSFCLLVVTSMYLKMNCKQHFPEGEFPILVAPNGADPVDQNLVVEPHVLQGEFRVGYVGQLYPGKGMEIVAQLAPLCQWAVFHIVGGLPQDITFWQAKLKNHANVIFHGHVLHSETPSYLAGMDVVVAPYLRDVRGVGGGDLNIAEGMSPLKIFEYMAHGKVIVTSDLLPIREILTNGKNSLLCAPESIEEWVNALDRLRQDADLRSRLGETARAEFLERYTWDRRAHSILEAIADRNSKEA